jgi:hypothetical protein
MAQRIIKLTFSIMNLLARKCTFILKRSAVLINIKDFYYHVRFLEDFIGKKTPPSHTPP